MKGEITLRLECLMPERLIDRATAQGARFEAVEKRDGRTLVVRCDAASAELLLSLCERFGLPAEIIDRRGSAAFRRFVCHRMTLFAGLGLAIVLCAVFLGRIWLIDIAFSGKTASLGDPAVLSRSLQAMGVRPGVSGSLDTDLIASALQADAGDYSYVGIHRQGIRLLVEAVPENPAPAVYDVDAARDLVSRANGIVTRAVVRSGELCVNPGDVVHRGQLLIRGEELSAQDETRPIAALGEVIVRTWYEGRAALPLTGQQQVDTGRRSIGTRLVTPFFQRDIISAGNYDSQRTEREYLPIGGLFLPMEIERTTQIETQAIQTDVGLDVLKKRLSALALADARLALYGNEGSDCDLGDYWIDYEYGDGMLSARAVLEIQTDAAVTREALQGG